MRRFQQRAAVVTNDEKVAPVKDANEIANHDAGDLVEGWLHSVTFGWTGRHRTLLPSPNDCAAVASVGILLSRRDSSCGIMWTQVNCT